MYDIKSKCSGSQPKLNPRSLRKHASRNDRYLSSRMSSRSRMHIKYTRPFVSHLDYKRLPNRF